jgi:hypothetical protein
LYGANQVQMLVKDQISLSLVETEYKKCPKGLSCLTLISTKPMDKELRAQIDNNELRPTLKVLFLCGDDLREFFGVFYPPSIYLPPNVVPGDRPTSIQQQLVNEQDRSKKAKIT